MPSLLKRLVSLSPWPRNSMRPIKARTFDTCDPTLRATANREASNMTGEIEVGDWVHHKPHAVVPREQTIQVPMLVTEMDDSGVTCTFDGQDAGAVHKFAISDLAKLDDAAESKARAEKSKDAKAAHKAKEEAKAKLEKHDETKAPAHKR